MGCNKCNKRPKPMGCKLPPVVELHSKECPVLFHTVELEGTHEDNPPYIGQFKNTLVQYTNDSVKYLFNSDGIYSAVSGATRFDELTGRPKYKGEEMTSETDIPDIDTAATAAAEAVIGAEAEARVEADQRLDGAISDESLARQLADSQINGKLNTKVMYDLEMEADENKVEFTEDLKNLYTGVTTTEVDTIPLASETQAGILNAAAYSSIKDSQDRLDALAGGAVSIADLPADPTQAQLTSAWEEATGITGVFNRASIFDSTNGKQWTYFTNTEAWEVTATVNQSITLDNFALGQAGLIVGDNSDGKVYAELDGTGSVYGWDTLSNAVANNTLAISGKQDALTAGSNITITGTTISATDTTYTSFIGTDGLEDGAAGLVPAPVVADAGKYLKADGSWATPPGTTYTAGANITITGTEISATNTTYSSFVGTDGTAAGTAGLVPAPATTDADKYLKSDGSWGTVSAGPTVVQTTGTSTTDVMSQKAATEMIWKDATQTATSQKVISIGDGISANTSSSINIIRRGSGSANGYANNSGIAIGSNISGSFVFADSSAVAIGVAAQAGSLGSIALGREAKANMSDGNNYYATAIGSGAIARGYSSVALGHGSRSSANYTISVGSGLTADSATYQYRRIVNVATPTGDHDAATKNYVDTAVASAGATAFPNNTFNQIVGA